MKSSEPGNSLESWNCLKSSKKAREGENSKKRERVNQD
jgi:hypothetical protein